MINLRSLMLFLLLFWLLLQLLLGLGIFFFLISKIRCGWGSSLAGKIGLRVIGLIALFFSFFLIVWGGILVEPRPKIYGNPRPLIAESILSLCCRWRKISKCGTARVAKHDLYNDVVCEIFFHKQCVLRMLTVTQSQTTQGEEL